MPYFNKHKAIDALKKIIAFQAMYKRLVTVRGLSSNSRVSKQIAHQITEWSIEAYEGFVIAKNMLLENELTEKDYLKVLRAFKAAIEECDLLNHQELHTQQILEEYKTMSIRAAA